MDCSSLLANTNKNLTASKVPEDNAEKKTRRPVPRKRLFRFKMNLPSKRRYSTNAADNASCRRKPLSELSQMEIMKAKDCKVYVTRLEDCFSKEFLEKIRNNMHLLDEDEDEEDNTDPQMPGETTEVRQHMEAIAAPKDEEPIY